MSSDKKDEWSAKIRAVLSDKNRTVPTDPLVNEKVEDARSDRELKKSYAKWFIWILVAQLLIMNFAFYGVGFGWLKYEKWTLDLYMGGTLAEVFGVILVITKNLFPLKK